MRTGFWAAVLASAVITAADADAMQHASPSGAVPAAVAPIPPMPPPPPEPAPGATRDAARTHNCVTFYPEDSAQDHESGSVRLGYDVEADGSISNVHLVKSSGFDRLDQAALACVRTAWRNVPAMQDGVAVASPGHQAIINFNVVSGAP